MLDFLADIPPRSIYAEAITQGVKDSGACAVIVSQAANESDAIKRELELASHYKKPFIPIRIDKTEPGPGLDYYLRNTQWIDYGRERERGLDRIVSHLKTGAGPTIARASSPERDFHPIRPRNIAINPLLVAGVLVTLVGGGLFVWSQRGDDYGTQASEATKPPESASTNHKADELRALKDNAAKLTKEPDDALASQSTTAEAAKTSERLQPSVSSPKTESSSIQNHANIIGRWSGKYTTGGIGFPMSLQINTDGTFYNDRGQRGTWTQEGNFVQIQFQGGVLYSGIWGNDVLNLREAAGGTMDLRGPN